MEKVNLYDCVVMKPWKPPYVMNEYEEKYVNFIELAGVSKEDTCIELQETLLTVTGVKKQHHEEPLRFCGQERLFGQFTRSIELLEEIEKLEMVTAKMENGVLEITLTKPP